MSIVNEIDYTKFAKSTKPRESKQIEPFGGYNGAIYYNGTHIGFLSNVNSNYPYAVSHGEWSGGFNSAKEALKSLLIHSGYLGKVHSLEDVFPDCYYILRISDLSIIYDADPKFPVYMTARVYYNSLQTTGSSAASKPATNEVCEIDFEKKIIHNRKGLMFVNQDDIFAKIQNRLDTCLQADITKT